MYRFPVAKNSQVTNLEFASIINLVYVNKIVHVCNANTVQLHKFFTIPHFPICNNPTCIVSDTLFHVKVITQISV